MSVMCFILPRPIKLIDFLGGRLSYLIKRAQVHHLLEAIFISGVRFCYHGAKLSDYCAEA